MRLVADDLTGALDSSAQFTGCLGPIPVHLGPHLPRVTGHAVLDLACRDGSESEAVRAARETVAFLDDTPAFKKIDSLLRGYWAAELAATLATGRFRHCIFAPAFPGQGRITRAGRQYVVDSDGRPRPLAVDIAQSLAKHGLTMVPGSETAAADAALSVLVFDAANADDLAGIVRYGRQLAGPVLWCGAAGLASALAGCPATSIAHIARPLLALIGSNHPVMQAQLAAARNIEACSVLALGGDPIENSRAIETAFSRDAGCIAYFALPDDIAPARAAETILLRLRDLIPALPKPATLIAAGGETLRAICAASAADHLLVLGESGPGIPYSRIFGGLWDGVHVMSKSGAFGTASFFADMLQKPA